MKNGGIFKQPYRGIAIDRVEYNEDLAEGGSIRVLSEQGYVALV